MHNIDNNNIVTDDAGSWWLFFVKAKMWFGSGRDSASLSSSGSLWTCSGLSGFCLLFLRSWFGVLTFDSNCIFAWSFCFLSPTSSKDRWYKKKKVIQIKIQTKVVNDGHSRPVQIWEHTYLKNRDITREVGIRSQVPTHMNRQFCTGAHEELSDWAPSEIIEFPLCCPPPHFQVWLYPCYRFWGP